MHTPMYQTTPLPPDIDYVLDQALDYGELHAFDHIVLTLLGDRNRIMWIVDSNAEGEPAERRLGCGFTLKGRHRVCFALDAYAHEIVDQLPERLGARFAAAALLTEPAKLQGIAEYLSAWAFEDETTGGAGLPFRDHLRCDDIYEPTPRARRKLYGRNAIRRAVKREDSSMPTARCLADGLRRIPPAPPEDADPIFALLNEQRASYRSTVIAAREQLLREQRQFYFGTREVRSMPRALPKPARKVMGKSLALATSVIGDERARQIVHGDSITLSGDDLSLRVRSAGRLTSRDHGALNVTLLDRDGESLAGLCVYFDQTPLLDQVAALALNVGAGETRALIEAGNLYNVTPRGAQHPIVAARLVQAKQKALADRAALEQLTFVPKSRGRRSWTVDRHQLQRLAITRYQAATLPLYIDAIKVAVWGQDAKRLRPFYEHAAAGAPAVVDDKPNWWQVAA